MKKQKKNKKTFFNPKSEKPMSVLIKNFFVFWFLALFFATILVQQDRFLIKMSETPQDVVFVLPGSPADWWMDDLEWWHGAAMDWSFLFDEEKEEELYKPDIVDSNNNLDDEFPFEADFVLSWLADEIDKLNTWEQKPVILEKKNCKTTWWEIVEHWDFILAYQQRKDVDNLCDVQRRFCNNWKLSGTYNQESCKEHTLYSYLRPEVVSYTQKPVDPLVQPWSPSLSGADFDVHGKIDWKTEPIDTRWPAGSGKKPNTSNTNQLPLSNNICNTPWWEKLKDWQIVKAYKSSVGLIDLPCEVEIRLCVGWQLKWSFVHQSCDFVQLTYSDYLNSSDSIANKNDISSAYSGKNESRLKINYFWTWIGKYFQ